MSKHPQHVAVITGAGSGLGRALAYALAERGVSLALVGRNREALAETAEHARSITSVVETYAIDITNDAIIAAFSYDLQSKFGGVDMLVHSAGVITIGTMQEALIEDFDVHYRVNVRAPYYLTQVLLPGIISRKGQIVFINSTMGISTKPGVSQYSATKHALRAIADTLRAEVNDVGVRVMSVFPGKMATPMQENISQKAGVEYRPEKMMQPEDVASSIVHALFLPHTAELTDLFIRPTSKSL